MGNRGSNIGKPVKEQRAYGDIQTPNYKIMVWGRCALAALKRVPPY